MVLWENLFISLHSYSNIKPGFCSQSFLPFYSHKFTLTSKLIKSETGNTFCSLWKLRVVIIYVNAFCHHVSPTS